MLRIAARAADMAEYLRRGGPPPGVRLPGRVPRQREKEWAQAFFDGLALGDGRVRMLGVRLAAVALVRPDLSALAERAAEFIARARSARRATTPKLLACRASGRLSGRAFVGAHPPTHTARLASEIYDMLNAAEPPPPPPPTVRWTRPRAGRRE